MSAPHKPSTTPHSNIAPSPARRILFMSLALLVWGLFGGEASAENQSKESPRIFERYFERLLRTSRGFFGTGSGSDAGTPDAGYTSAFLEFLTANNPGLDTLSSPTSALCDALGTPVNGWCLNGDGTTAAGSTYTMVADGGVTTDTSLTLCPSGPDCSPITGQRAQVISTSSASNGIFYTDSAYLMPYTPSSPALSGCWFGISRSPGNLITHRLSNATADNVFTLSASSISTTDNILFYNAGTTAETRYVPILSCFTRPAGAYQRWKYYLNGEFQAETLPINMPGVTAHDTVFGTNGSPFTSSVTGDQIMYGAFITRAQLSATRIRELAEAVFPGAPKLTRNGVPSRSTIMRSNSKYCEKSDGGGSFVSNNIPCVSGGKYTVDALSRNLLPDMSAASWTKATSSGVLTASAAIGVSGLTDAARLECNTADGGASCRLTQSVTLDAGMHTISLYVKGVSTSADSGVYTYVQGSIPDIAVACEYNPNTWTRCLNAQQVPTAGTKTVVIGCLSGSRGMPTCPGMDVYLSGTQLEDGPIATALIPSRGTSLTRGGDALAVSTSIIGTSSDAGCFRVSWVQPSTSVEDAGILAVTSGVTLAQGAISLGGSNLYVGGSKLIVGSTPDAGTNTLIARWNETSSSLTLNGVTTGGAGGSPGTYNTLRIGNNDDGGTLVQPGRYSDIKVGQTFNACD